MSNPLPLGWGKTVVGLALVLGAGLAVLVAWRRGEFGLAVLSAVGPTIGLITWLECERQHHRVLRELRSLAQLVKHPDAPIECGLFRVPEVALLAQRWASPRSDLGRDQPGVPPRDNPNLVLTASGMFDPPSLSEGEGQESGDDRISDLVGRLEPSGLRWVEASSALTAFLAWSAEELSLRSFPEMVHPDDRDLAREQMLAALAKGEAHGLIYRIVTATGQLRVVEFHVGVRYGADRAPSHLRCHLIDVTAKVRASRELRRRTRELTRANVLLRQANRELAELKNHYSDLYQNAPTMYFSLDDRGCLVVCNNTLLKTLGYRRHELIGQSYENILAPDQRTVFAEQLESFRQHGRLEIETRWLAATGQTLDVAITGLAVRCPDGRIQCTRCVARDVSDNKALEAALNERNERLALAVEELSRRNRELDEFTQGISHDLQEPIRTLIAFSEFLMNDYGDRLDPEGREYIRYLVDASKRMRSLINDLLSLSRAGRITDDFSPVNLEQVLSILKADLAELLRAQGGQVILRSPLPILWGDRDRIAQLFSNLLGNALKYHRDSPPIVEVGAVPSGEQDWAILFVRDNGIGIAPEYHEKIFQLFRRLHTREQYEGTGAGLAICLKIVQAHGGRIWVESQPGEGATFFVKLPACSEERDAIARFEAISPRL
jgi:PAS domain S-box-containing protein